MRILLKSLGALFGLLIFAAVALFFLGWSRAPDMLADTLSEKLKVPVTIDDIHLSFNSIDIEKIDISNPKNSILPKAFTAEKTLLQAPLFNYLKKDIVVDEIAIDQIYLGLEFDSISGTKGNWTTLMQNMESSQGPAPKTSTTGAKKTLLIKKVVLTNISVEVVYKQGDRKVKRLPMIKRIELTNISSEGGFPTDQIAHSVLGEMLKSVFLKEHLKNMFEDLIKGPGSTYDKLLEPFKGIFQ